jgi:transcriptional regulator with XRE-family HTH domain
MNDTGLLALRMSWLRKQRGITLQQLSERSALAVSYLCQLEKGHRTNPTSQTVCAVAGALGVRPAFLFGEPAPGASMADELGRQFQRYVAQLPPARQQHLALADTTERFAAVAKYLLDQHPDLFTPAELACHLHMSLPQLDDLLANRVEVSHIYMEQLAQLSGVPLHYIATGSFDAPAPISTEEMTRQALEHLARMYHVSPERLEQLIEAAIVQKA